MGAWVKRGGAYDLATPDGQWIEVAVGACVTWISFLPFEERTWDGAKQRRRNAKTDDEVEASIVACEWIFVCVKMGATWWAKRRR